MTSPVKIYSSFMQGAPQLTYADGAMTNLLDAVLVNGFNSRAPNTITSAAGIATASILAGHQYQVNQIVTIGGANQAEYNGEFKVLSVTTTEFTYAISGNPVSPATGTSLSCIASPLGWSIAFGAGMKRAYRSNSVSSNRPYLRVDDGLDPAYTATYAKKAKVTMAQGMTDVNIFQGTYAPYDAALPTKGETGTGTGTAAIDGWFKWYYAKAGANSADTTTPAVANRQWLIIGDDRGFYIFNEGFDGGGLVGHCFTDFVSYRAGDGFNTILCATDNYSAASVNPSTWPVGAGEGYQSSDHCARFPRMLDTLGKLVLRPYLQVGAAQPVSFVSLNTGGSGVSGYSTGLAFPNGPDYGVILHPTMIKENNHLRGKMPGMFWIHNDASTMAHGDLLTGVSGYPGRTFYVVKVAHGESSGKYAAFLAFDITGPWW